MNLLPLWPLGLAVVGGMVVTLVYLFCANKELKQALRDQHEYGKKAAVLVDQAQKEATRCQGQCAQLQKESDEKSRTIRHYEDLLQEARRDQKWYATRLEEAERRLENGRTALGAPRGEA